MFLLRHISAPNAKQNKKEEKKKKKKKKKQQQTAKAQLTAKHFLYARCAVVHSSAMVRVVFMLDVTVRAI